MLRRDIVDQVLYFVAAEDEPGPVRPTRHYFGDLGYLSTLSSLI